MFSLLLQTYAYVQDNLHPRLAVQIYKEFKAGNLQEAYRLQVKMNNTIQLLIDSCDCRTRGTNIIGGIKRLYRRMHGMDVGEGRESMVTPLSKEKEDALVAAIEAEPEKYDLH